jgi:adenylosuccinate lyase
MSEPAMMRLGATLGRQEVHEIFYAICMQVFARDKSFKEALIQALQI